MSNRDLDRALARMNAEQGYTNRYRIVREFARASHRSYRVALFKAEGGCDRNVTGWVSPDYMLGFLLGHIEGFGAHARRMARGF